VDLELRGPGDLMGTRQSGILDLKIANLATDSKVLQYARNCAMDILEEDSGLDLPKHAPVAQRALEIIKGKPNWSQIS
ncbi:MAG: ATP-dependent DNA helicase RecG, partial [Flavobacteriales bacterium]|nr:ATP-dependent DNA helicase RecG [Flavobacteriales bacterium]